jgi:signal peptidase I
MRKYINVRNVIFVAFLVTIVLIRVFVLFPATISGNSMQPTLADGERVFAWKTSDVQQKDIIVFESPTEQGKMFVKRVIGTPGDKIKVEKDRIYVNDQRLNEDYLITYEGEYDFKLLGTHFETVVPDGEYFVLGDNRFNSSDSRMFGTIARESVQGKVVFGIQFALF